MPALVEIFLAHYRDHIADFSRPFPGVAETLERLKADGARLGVLTNKPQELTEPLLAAAGPGRRSSPPSMARAASPTPSPIRASFMMSVTDDAAAARRVMIGDSITDLHTARAAGVPCILMSYGYTPVPARGTGRRHGAGRFCRFAGGNQGAWAWARATFHPFPAKLCRQGRSRPGARLTGLGGPPIALPPPRSVSCEEARPGNRRARSSAGEHSLHTGGVTGSIPVAPTIKSKTKKNCKAAIKRGLPFNVRRNALSAQVKLWRKRVVVQIGHWFISATSVSADKGRDALAIF